jgi:hypothetical protein
MARIVEWKKRAVLEYSLALGLRKIFKRGPFDFEKRGRVRIFFQRLACGKYSNTAL